MRLLIIACGLLVVSAPGCLYKKAGTNVPIQDIQTDQRMSDAAADTVGQTDSPNPNDGKPQELLDQRDDVPVGLDVPDSTPPNDVPPADGIADSLVDTLDAGDTTPPTDAKNDVDDILDTLTPPTDVVDVVDLVDVLQDLAGPDAALDQQDSAQDLGPDIVTPPCEGYAAQGGMVCPDSRPNKVPAIRLMFSLTGSTGDATVCGGVSWKLGNRILLQGNTPDGMARGKLTGAEIYYDLDEPLEDDMYVDSQGNPMGYPLVIELLDEDQQVIWRGRRREPLQVREYVWKALEANTGMAPSAGLVSMVAAALGADFEAYTTTIPDLPEARFLRFSRDWSSAEKAAISACNTAVPLVMPTKVKSSGPVQTLVNLADINPVPLQLFTDKVGLPEVTRIFGTQDPVDAVNFVVLAEGYTADQKAKFETDAQAVATYLSELDPFSTFSGQLNVWRIWTPSPTPGASYDCGCSFFETDSQNCTVPHDGCVEGLRSNVYGAVFAVRALYHLQTMLNPLAVPPSLSADRNIFPLFLFRVGMAMSLSDSEGTPVAGDAAFVLINEDKEGAFGLFNAAVTTAYQATGGMVEFTEVATHEMGHAFGLLGDEYTTSTDVCQMFELTPLFPNFSPIPAAVTDIPWEPWVTMSGPFPNTEDQGTADAVGCYIPPPGGGICKDGSNQPLLCRPTKTCKMKTNGGEFCSICTDHVVHRIFNRIDIMDSEEFEVQLVSAGVYQFNMPVSLPDVQGSWTLDGASTPTAPLVPYTLDTTLLTPGEHTLELTVNYPTPLSRIWTNALTETKSVKIHIP